MAAPGETPKPAVVEAPKAPAPKAEAPKPTPAELQKAREDAEREAHAGTRGKLDTLKSNVVPPLSATVPLVDSEKNILFDKVAKEMEAWSPDVPFTKKDNQTCLDRVFARAKEVVSRWPETNDSQKAEKANAVAVFMDKFFGSYVDALMLKYPYILTDGADDSIQVKFKIENGKAVILDMDPVNKQKYDQAVKLGMEAVQKQADATLKTEQESAAKAGSEKEQGDAVAKARAEFREKNPGVEGVLKQFVFGGDEAKMNEAFAGVGTWGIIFGFLGIGLGKGLVDVLRGTKWFGKYVDQAADHLAELTDGALDHRKLEDLKDQPTFAKLFEGVVPGQTKTIKKRFIAKAEVTLPADMYVAAIRFAKPGEVKLANGSVQKFEKDNETHEKITLAKGTKLPPETEFRDLVIGKIETVEAGKA